MKLIFESETELGRCDPDQINSHFGDDPGDWMAIAHTTAAMTHSNGMLRIEQRCYLRSAECPNEVRSQSWVAPEMAFEPMLGSREKTIRLVQKAHERFVSNAKREFTEQSLLAMHSDVAELT